MAKFNLKTYARAGAQARAAELADCGTELDLSHVPGASPWSIGEWRQDAEASFHEPGAEGCRVETDEGVLGREKTSQIGTTAKGMDLNS